MMHLGEPIAKGNTAKIYLHDGKVVKIFNDGLPDAQAECEAYKQRYSYACGLNVPFIYEVTKVNGSQAIIMEHVAGKTIGETILEDMSTAERYMDLSVDVQLKIHSVKAPDLESMADKLRRQVSTARPLREDQKNALMKKLSAIQYDSRLCHGDYHVFNLIFKGNQVCILDWLDASAGDVRADACRSYLLYSEYSTDLAEMYLRLYCLKSGIPRAEILPWMPIVAGARLSENISLEAASGLIKIVSQYCPL